MNAKYKYLWITLFFIVCSLFLYQIYKTNTMRKEYLKLISNQEVIEENYNYNLTMVSFFNKLIEKLSIEHNKHISKQQILDFFTYENYCYLKEVKSNDDFLLKLIKEKDYSIDFDSVLELEDCSYYFLFFKDDFVGTIDIWSSNGNCHLDWYLRNHELFRYE